MSASASPTPAPAIPQLPGAPAPPTATAASAGPRIESPEELGLNPNEEIPIPEEVYRLHEYLRKSASLKEEYHQPRPWSLSITGIRFHSQSEAPQSIFINFIVLDRRQLSGISGCLATVLCPTAAQSELRSKTICTNVIDGIKPDQVVEFSDAITVSDWFSIKDIRMSYAQTLSYKLRVEVWQYSRWGANVLLGALLIPFPNILMSTVEQSAVIQRNVAPTARGQSTIVGALNFSCELRESYLYHDIGFRHWSIALSNGLMAKDFTHGLHGFVSGACCCGGLACCVTSDNSCTHLAGCAESVSVDVEYNSTAGGEKQEHVIPSYNNGRGMHGHIGFTAPLNSWQMERTGNVPESRGDADSGTAPSSGRALTYAPLDPLDGGRQCIVVRSPLPAVEGHELAVTVRLKCRRCCQEGYGTARVPLRGLTSATFCPFSVPIIFQRDTGCCGLYFTAGVLRGFNVWRVHDTPLVMQFLQARSSTTPEDEGQPQTLLLCNNTLDMPDPCLKMTIHGITGLLPAVPERLGTSAADPRVTITWAGTTLSTAAKYATYAPEFHETLSFALPSLAGRNPHGRFADKLKNLCPPLGNFRHALIQIWDDSSALPNVSSISDTIHGRRVRKPYLIAEARVEVPIYALLGLTIREVQNDEDNRPKPHAVTRCCGEMTCAEAAAKNCSINKGTSALAPIRVVHKLISPKRGTAAATRAQKRQNVQISVSYQFENVGLEGLVPTCVPSLDTRGTSLMPYLEESLPQGDSASTFVRNDGRPPRPAGKKRDSVEETSPTELNVEQELHVENNRNVPFPAIFDLSHACWRAVRVLLSQASWNHSRAPEWWLASTVYIVSLTSLTTRGALSFKKRLLKKRDGLTQEEETKRKAAADKETERRKLEAARKKAQHEIKVFTQNVVTSKAALSAAKAAAQRDGRLVGDIRRATLHLAKHESQKADAEELLKKCNAALGDASDASDEIVIAAAGAESSLPRSEQDKNMPSKESMLNSEHICPFLLVRDEHDLLRALPSLLSPVPVDTALVRMASHLAKFAVDMTAADQLKAATAVSEYESASASVKAEQTMHLVYRAAQMVAGIELSNSKADIGSTRQDLEVAWQRRSIIILQSPPEVLVNKIPLLHAPTGAPDKEGPWHDNTLLRPAEQIAMYATAVFSMFLKLSWPSAWMSPSLFLSLGRGGIAEHAVLLHAMISGLTSSMAQRTYFCVCTVTNEAKGHNLGRSDQSDAFALAVKDMLKRIKKHEKGEKSDMQSASKAVTGLAEPSQRESSARATAPSFQQRPRSEPRLRSVHTLPEFHEDSDQRMHRSYGLGIGPPGELTEPDDAGASVAGARDKGRHGDWIDLDHQYPPHSKGGSQGRHAEPISSDAENRYTDKDAERRRRGRSEGAGRRKARSKAGKGLVAEPAPPPVNGSTTSSDVDASAQQVDEAIESMKRALEVIAQEKLHFCVAVLPDAADPDSKVLLYDIDGTVHDPVDEAGEGKKGNFRRVLMLANAHDVWVNLQLDRKPVDDAAATPAVGSDHEHAGDHEDPPPSTAATIVQRTQKAVKAAADAKASEKTRPLASLPSLIATTVFDLSHGDLWMAVLDRTADRGTLGKDDWINNEAAAQPTSGITGPGIWAPGPTRELGSKLGACLDGAAFAGPAPCMPFLKRNLMDMELSSLTTLVRDITNALVDGIEITRAAAHLGSAVVSNRPAYRVLVQQLKGLLVAKARVEMYHPNTKDRMHEAEEMKFNALKNTIHNVLVTGAVRATEPAAGQRKGTSVNAEPKEIASTEAQSVFSVSAGPNLRDRVLDVGGVGVGYGLKIWRVNSGSPEIVRRSILGQLQYGRSQAAPTGPDVPDDEAAGVSADTTTSGLSPWFSRPGQEICVAVFVQQPMTGMLITRVAAMSVWPGQDAP